MKRILALVLTLAMAFALCACGQSVDTKEESGETADSGNSETSTSEPIKVRIASQFGDEHPQSVALYYFKDILEERSNG